MQANYYGFAAARAATVTSMRSAAARGTGLRRSVRWRVRKKEQPMRHLWLWLGCLLWLPGMPGLSWQAAGQGAPGAAPRPIALRAARMLDVKAGAHVPNATVLVENGRIAAAGANVPLPATALVKELGDVTLLPGL